MKRMLVLVLALCVAACSDDSTAPAGSDQLVVGALLSLTGPGRTLGQTSEAALHLAADDLNARLSGDGSPTRVSVRVEDTGLDPAQALDRLRTIAGEGVRIFVGPQSSSEVAALKPFADSAGVIILSQGSTASSLSIPDDNVFRLVPDRLARGSGGGGAPGRYPPGTADFSAQLQAIKSQIGDAVAGSGAGAVAVYLAAFEESAAIFAQASGDPAFAQVRWYGGDGTVQSAAVVADPTSAAFAAAAAAFRAPTYGLGDQLLQEDAELIGTIADRSGLPPDAFTLAAYDALHVATLAYAAVGLESIETYRSELLTQAGAYTGATGPTELNTAGDRAVGDYEFYQVCAGTTPSWTRVAAYQAAGGTIVSVGAC